MKNRITLYTEPKKTAITSLMFTMISLFLMLVLILSVNKDAIRVNTLLNSDYDYSATMRDTVHKDDYFQFNASIEFALSADADTRLNAEVIMQSRDSAYTDKIYWKADTLSTNGVAVSKNLAKSHGLRIGDKLYSKHIVDGEKRGYIIEQVLPETVEVSISEGISHSDGIIIMGYDERYIENITHSSIAFTKDSISGLSAVGSPENIVYREDEIAGTIRHIIPYIAIMGVVSIAITAVLVVLLTKALSSNFRRLIMLGFKKKQLNGAYFKVILRAGLISIIASLALSCTVFLFINFSVIKAVLLLFMHLMELITLFITSGISNKRLWRK